MQDFSSTADARPRQTSGSELSARMHVYVGTNTSSGSRGIYRFGLDTTNGTTTALELAAEVKNPTFLASSPDRRFLYAVSEISDFDGKKAGGVSAFKLDATTGNLTLINQQPSGGKGPCHVTVSPDGKYAATANYGNGSIALLPINADGSLTSPTSVHQHVGSSVYPKRQDGPHAHSVNFDPDGRFLYAADLGIDRVKIYRLDKANDSLVPAEPPETPVAAGAGPRHLAFHPNGQFVYVINEMGNTVTVFSFDSNSGSLTETQTTSTLPKGFTDKSFCAEVRVHPSGKYLYGSNRGHDSIAIFSIDEHGQLTTIGHESTGGKIPRNFNIDPTGQWLVAANQDSDNIVLFRIDQDSGAMIRSGEITGVSRPVCILFMPLH